MDPHDARRRQPRASPPRSPTCSAGCRRRTPSSTTRRRRSRSRRTRASGRDASPRRWSPDLGLPTDADAYVCGPEPFMDDVAAALAGVGIDPARIHTERFGSRSPINPGVVGADAPPPHQPPGPPGAGPAVTFARSGLTTAWSDAYASVLELAEACDVPTQWSCRTGVCHTCVTAVLSGEASYDDPAARGARRGRAADLLGAADRGPRDRPLGRARCGRGVSAARGRGWWWRP